MSSSKVIYVNDDDMLGGMFNNETKPVNTPEHTPEHTQMMTPTISKEQTGGGESTMKPPTPMEVTQLAPLQPVTIQHTAMVQQQQPTTVQHNTLEAIPVMTGGKKKKKKKNDNADDDNDNEESESESETDESDTEESSQKQDKKDDDDSCSDTSSICTEQLLTFDPMYIKLTKFLYTSDGTYGRNITQVLEGIEKQMERLADALQKSTLMSMSSTETNREEE